MKSIAIIGAGAAGLCAARHALAAGHQVNVFEQTDQLGGTWVYRDAVQRDSNGVELEHSSMYSGLITNLPKEIMCYPDVPFAEQTNSFVPSDDVHAYLDTFADRFQLRSLVRLGHQVIRVRPVGDQPMRWEIIVRDLQRDHCDTLYFDAVFICNGHYSVPKMPDYPGRNLFTGNLMHSHAYRTPETFVGRTVLIIGASASAFELMTNIGQHADRVALSHHKKAVPAAFLPEALTRPAVERFTASTVVFSDGRAEEYTDVVICTGYKYAFPFLSADCGLYVEEHAFVRPLFKECINIEQPTMFVLGVPFRCCPLMVMDLQARFCLAYLDGARELPARAEMLAITEADMQQRRDKYGGYVRHMHMHESFQAEYSEDLASLGGVEPIKPYVFGIYEDVVTGLFKKSRQFRQQRYRVKNDVEFEKTLPGDA